MVRPCPGIPSPGGRWRGRKADGSFTSRFASSLLYTSYGSAAISAACSAAGRTHENGLTTAMPVTSPYYFYPASILHSILYKRNSSMTIFRTWMNYNYISQLPSSYAAVLFSFRLYFLALDHTDLIHSADLFQGGQPPPLSPGSPDQEACTHTCRGSCSSYWRLLIPSAARIDVI